ncbi:MAG: RidA family protein [Phenylobacterium sp.]|uniref:RidA family protein n=1 Tax=Phenylobacterium sp. TaxID=1871053 RepID=UPI00391AED7A
MRNLILPALAAAVLAASPAAAQVQRIGAPTSPILQAAVVPAGTDIVYVSGITPPALNAGAPSGTPPEFGDTKTQTVGVLKRIEDILKAQGLGMGDIFMMRVLLVGDPDKGGRMDFAGMMEGYNQFFGTPEQPNKVARITSQVAGLVAPGMMVEIEVQAAKPKK